MWPHTNVHDSRFDVLWLSVSAESWFMCQGFTFTAVFISHTFTSLSLRNSGCLVGSVVDQLVRGLVVHTDHFTINQSRDSDSLEAAQFKSDVSL